MNVRNEDCGDIMKKTVTLQLRVHVDKGIAPLVKELTRFPNVVTVSCCTGHKDGDAAFVLFWCPSKKTLQKILEASDNDYTHMRIDYYPEWEDWVESEFRYAVNFQGPTISKTLEAINEMTKKLRARRRKRRKKR